MKQKPGQLTKQKPYQLTAVDYEILRFVHEFHFLTAEQIVTLRYSKNSLPTAQIRLKALADNKFLDRRVMPRIKPGNPEYIYYLSTKGQHSLEEAGYSGFSRVRKSEIDRMEFPHLQHVLSLNDFLIAARLLPRAVPSISLVETRHDLDLKKTPVRVTVERRLPYGDRTDERITVIPDGWLDFRMVVPDRPKPRRRCIVLELDRGTTTNVGIFKQKIRGYYAFAISEEYQELFGTDLCMVCYASTSGEYRMQTIKKWCEDELEMQRLEHEANLFRFMALPQGDFNPQEIFLSERCYKPFEDQPVSLLWKQ